MGTMALRAAALADKWHSGQRRRFTNLPYINHPMAVATLVGMVSGDEEVISAAMLHDILEDTGCPPEEILAATSRRVLLLVIALTDPAISKDDPFYSRRTDLKMMRAINLPPAAVTVRLADIYHNASEMDAADGNFASKYLTEKAAIVFALGMKGENPLLAKASGEVLYWLKKFLPLSPVVPIISA